MEVNNFCMSCTTCTCYDGIVYELWESNVYCDYLFIDSVLYQYCKISFVHMEYTLETNTQEVKYTLSIYIVFHCSHIIVMLVSFDLLMAIGIGLNRVSIYLRLFNGIFISCRSA